MIEPLSAAVVDVNGVLTLDGDLLLGLEARLRDLRTEQLLTAFSAAVHRNREGVQGPEAARPRTHNDGEPAPRRLSLGGGVKA